MLLHKIHSWEGRGGHTLAAMVGLVEREHRLQTNLGGNIYPFASGHSTVGGPSLMQISSLYIDNVGPFHEMSFDVNQPVNVFLGPNNTGKSTTLWALAEILVYPFSFPSKLLRPDMNATYRLNLDNYEDREFAGTLPILAIGKSSDRDSMDIESLTELYRTTLDHVESYIDLLEIIGYTAFVPALRHSTEFRSPGPAASGTKHDESPTATMNEQMASQLSRARREITSSNNRTVAELLNHPELQKRKALPSTDPMLTTNENVIQGMVELDYRSYLTRNPVSQNTIGKIGEVASDMTDGYIIGFAGVHEDSEGFSPKFDTKDGPLPLNTLSQGTQSIIQWLAHFVMGFAQYYGFPKHLEEQSGVLIIDEVDAHLHPSWQRRIIPALSRHFPRIQLFCSTHSPLAIAGLKQGQVQRLDRDERGAMVVSTNDRDIVGWTSDEILRSMLGVNDPVDLETIARLEHIDQLRDRDTLTANETAELRSLRDRVGADLTSGPGSELVERFADQLRRARDASGTDADHNMP